MNATFWKELEQMLTAARQLLQPTRPAPQPARVAAWPPRRFNRRPTTLKIYADAARTSHQVPRI